jgi:hypothetical protein
MLNLTHTTSGTPAAGIGTDIAFTVETAAGNNEKGMILEALTTDVGSDTEDFDFIVKLMKDGAAAAEKMRLSSSGDLTIQGSFSFAGGLTPNTANGGSLGSTSKEWADLYLADGGIIYLGNDQEVTLTHVHDTGLLLNGSKQLQFGDSGTYIHQSAADDLQLVSDGTITLNADTDIILDANGADIFLKDDGTTFGSLTNSSSNLVIKSGTTTALTFSGANATLAGTLGSGAVTSTGDSSFDQITVDNVVINDKSITMTGSADDTATFTVAENGALTIQTVDTAAEAANISITADGTNTIAGTTITLDSAGDIELDAGGADVILKDDGTTFGSLTNSSSNLVIKSGTTTALTFSGANVTMGGNITIPDSGDIGSATIPGAINISNTGLVDVSSLAIGGISVTATATELNLVDGITAGTALASKAVILDSTKNITSLGTIGSGAITSTGDSSFGQITVDNIVINDKSITMTGSTDDTATFTVADNGALTIQTVDTAAAAANISITADGTNTIAGTTITLDSAGDIELDAGGADIILKDDGTTFGSFTQSSGELIIKSGSTPTTAITFSGANATLGGTLGCGAISTTGDMTIFDDTNNADTSFKIGTSATECLSIEVLNGTSNKTAEEIKFSTHTESSDSTHGKFTFVVDDSQKVAIDDDGLTLTNGNIIIPNNGNIGSASVTGAISISSTGLVNVSSLAISNTTVTSSASELNLVNAITAGTASASKAVILDSGKNITSLGTIGSGAITSTGNSSFGQITVDNVVINDKSITMTGSTDDTATFTVADNGALTIQTVDTAAAAANISITADGTNTIAGTNITLDSAGDIELDAGGADIILKDDGTTFGSFTQSSGELIIKSGSTPTTAITFSGANATLGGTLGCGAISTTGDMTIFDDTNNADTSFKIGTSATECLSIEVLNGTSNKTAEEIKFSTHTESSDAAHGKFTFVVDDSQKVTIDDDGLTLTNGNIVLPDNGTVGSTTNNSAITIASNGSLTLGTSSTVTNTVTEMLNLTHTTSGTPAAGIGTDIAFTVETSAGNNEKGMILEALTTSVSSTSEDFDYVVKLMESGAAATERMRLSSDGHLTVGDHNTGANAGSNWPGPTVPKYIGQIQGEYVMTLHVDITNAESKADILDVIGTGTSSSVYIGKCSTTYVGYVYKAEMMCIEVPAGGDLDVDLYSNTADLATDDAVTSSGTSVELINAGGNWAVGMRKISTAGLTMTDGLHDHYLYLTTGGGTAGTYTAGKFVIKLYGAKF